MDEKLFTNSEFIHSTEVRAESCIDAATKALYSMNAQPERVKVFHNGNIYLDIPIIKGRIRCPINVEEGSIKIEIWGKKPKSKFQFEPSSCFIKESVH
ncbi:hypothetical protein BW727_101317 [Jeotgalibaca dankookensis]|uniref:Uncharacterized protein n=1 Tax=Jeotgalibaca dankookensis TaxID=708126 RepID=A0A1S6IQ68_9LACT|nr:hypothetical protein [Jeotgalibaca dankookensis]AQS53684.1 hypothetical protein BW727_101317 [Jeotgalibaca dankookensis]